MSINKASETWDMLEPFAQRWLEGMLGDGKSGDPAKDGYFIILYDASGQVKREYSFSLDGLNAALAAAESGDVVWMPAGSLATDITVPEGVAVVGDGMNCIIAGTVILGAGAELRDMTVEVSNDLESEIVAVVGPASGRAFIRNSDISAFNCGSGDAIGIDDDGGVVEILGSYVNGESSSGHGYAVRSGETIVVPDPEDPPDDPTPPVVPEPEEPDPGDTYVESGESIQTAINASTAGDIIWVRAGTYAEKITLNKAITLVAYPDETVVIDGEYSDDIVGYWSTLVSVTAAGAVFEGFEVKRSQYIGVLIASTAVGAVVRDIYSHHNMENGILSQADDSVIEYCYAYYNCMSNENGTMTRESWASGLSAARSPDNVTMRYNRVRQNWGEGLSTYESTNIHMHGNTVWDNYATNIYISDTTDCLCEQNLVYMTGAMTVGGRHGIMMGDERSSPRSARNTVINNIVFGGMHCFYFFNNGSYYPNDGMLDVLIAHNLFMNSQGNYTVQINYTVHATSYFVDNIVVQEDGKPISLFAGSTYTVDYNLFSKTPDAPGQGGSNLVGDPLLAKTGSYTDVDFYRLGAGSPAIDSASVLAAVDDDYEGTARTTDRDRGPFET